MKRFTILVSGKVQGVFFRASTEKMAKKIGLTGFVKNQSDGRVYIEAQGTPEQLEIFFDWCERGPERAEVSQVFKSEIPEKTESSFLIVKTS